MARRALTFRGQMLRVGLAIPALAGIFLLGQALLHERGWRLDLTPERRYTLSPHARQVLGGLDRDVRVLAFLRSQDPRNPRIEDLLRQVRALAPRVQIDMVDVNRNPALAREYGVDSYGAMVVESEGRRRVFSNPREETLVAAVLQVTRQQRRSIAWVTGHGEGDPMSSERQARIASARTFLEQEDYEVVPVSLLGDEVPVGTAVVLVVGRRRTSCRRSWRRSTGISSGRATPSCCSPRTRRRRWRASSASIASHSRTRWWSTRRPGCMGASTSPCRSTTIGERTRFSPRWRPLRCSR